MYENNPWLSEHEGHGFISYSNKTGQALSCNGKDANLRVCLEVRRETLGNIVLKHV